MAWRGGRTKREREGEEALAGELRGEKRENEKEWKRGR
jgi:hypothetical protein